MVDHDFLVEGKHDQKALDDGSGEIKKVKFKKL